MLLGPKWQQGLGEDGKVGVPAAVRGKTVHGIKTCQEVEDGINDFTRDVRREGILDVKKELSLSGTHVEENEE